jgi:hypothetical protein
MGRERRRRVARALWPMSLLPATVLCVSATVVNAQFPAFTPLGPGLSGQLTKEDFVLYETAAHTLLEGGPPPGTMAKWDDVRTGNSGIVQLVTSFDYGGLHCKTLRVRFHFKNPDLHDSNPYTLNYCRVATGEWKLFS